MIVSVEHPTQPKDIQQELEAKVQAAQPTDAGKDGLIRILVQGLLFIGRLFISGRIKRFEVERCERVGDAADRSNASGKQASERSKAKVKAPAKRSNASGKQASERSK